MRKRNLRPSPAIVVAIVALVAALAGTAIAGPGASSSKITKKKVVKIADKEIAKLAPGLSVEHANTAASANSANTANSATSATSADAAHRLATTSVHTADFTVGASPANNGTTASCPAGTQAISGGVRSDTTLTTGRVTTSRPTISPDTSPTGGQTFDGWRAFVSNEGATPLNSTVYVVCAS